MVVFSSGDAFRLVPPAAPWCDSVSHSRRFSPVRALAACSVASAWCCYLVVSLARLGPEFGASPCPLVPGLRSEVCFPALAVGSLGCGARRCRLFPYSSPWAGVFRRPQLRRPQLSDCLSLSGRLCSGALLFLSPLGSCGRAVSAPRMLLSPDPAALVSWPGRDLVPGLCAVVCPPGLAAVLLCTPWVRRTCPGGLCLVLPFSAGERIVEAQPTDKPINIRKNICQTAFP